MALPVFQIARVQRVAASASTVHVHFYCTHHNPQIKKPKMHSLRRGTGGRSSFSGIVATVFGSSGFLGRYVCNRLGKIGTQLILPYRGDAGDMLPLKLCGDLGQVLFQPYNLKDDESIYKSLMYSNTVINLVGRDWETKNYSFDDVHVEEKPEPFMLPKGSKWLASKWAGENAVREEFPEAVIIRPSDIYGQEDRFLRYYCNNFRRTFDMIPLYKKGEFTEKQPVYAGDVAAGIVAACRDRTVRGEIIQAVGPNRYLLSELVDWFFRVTRLDDGCKRYDMRYDPLFQLRVSLLPYFSLGFPLGNIHWERVERENFSDAVDNRIKTLEDLGVKLTKMEDQVPWELKIFKRYTYYEAELGEFEEPSPPRVIQV
ncbi:NmrA-like family [Nesidiocoris tenuis]|uniref:NADH dehydrogenase [ubiquinone] 1 alpha subcomplex subunit 9, mitochondrial n=1 Tax=Nesidiocoris tenuis TaxID=355587 RepID=A0ABN7AGP9_9HEMI|nr:NmrA-like family [Nesidiocoris tenuis]